MTEGVAALPRRRRLFAADTAVLIDSRLHQWSSLEATEMTEAETR